MLGQMMEILVVILDGQVVFQEILQLLVTGPAPLVITVYHESNHQKTTAGSITPQENVFNPRRAPSITSIEILTRTKPYPGLNGIEVATQVVSNGLRPQFPSGTQMDLQEIISKCWEEDPNERPTFKQLLAQLQQLK